jgi:hypothetical protein
MLQRSCEEFDCDLHVAKVARHPAADKPLSAKNGFDGGQKLTPGSYYRKHLLWFRFRKGHSTRTQIWSRLQWSAYRSIRLTEGRGIAWRRLPPCLRTLPRIHNLGFYCPDDVFLFFCALAEVLGVSLPPISSLSHYLRLSQSELGCTRVENRWDEKVDPDHGWR